MSNAEKAHEPSMDDIINSIRNIIADDTSESSAQPQQKGEAPIVQLTESQIAKPGVNSEASTVGDQSGVNTENDGAPIATEAVPTIEDSKTGENSATALQTNTELTDAPSFEQASNEHILTHVESVDPEEKVLLGSNEVESELSAVKTASPINVVEETPIAQNEASSSNMSGQDNVGSQAASAENFRVQPRDQIQASTQKVDEATVAKPEAVSPIETASSTNELINIDNPEANVVIATDQEKDFVNEMIQELDTQSTVLDEIKTDIDPDKILENKPSFSSGDEVATNVGLVDKIPETSTIPAVSPTDNQMPTIQEEISKAKSGLTLEDSVREMLKPMIKEWLDENMPRILEAIVKEEKTKPGNN